MLAVRRVSGGGFPYRVGCKHQAALPPVCVAGGHLPCALQHTKRAFFPKKAKALKDLHEGGHDPEF